MSRNTGRCDTDDGPLTATFSAAEALISVGNYDTSVLS